MSRIRLLLLCHQPDELKTQNGMINTLSTIYAYHFGNIFSKMADVDVTYSYAFITMEVINNLEDHDFCISMVNRGITYLSEPILQALRTKVKYQIMTICGSGKIIDREDVLIFMMGKVRPNTMRAHWGAEFQLLRPQKPNTITILVDHVYYGKANCRLMSMDKTKNIINSLIDYKKTGQNIVVKHISSNGIVTVGEGYQVQPFKQSYAVDFREIYKVYNECHMYIVTHPECLGLSTIECASAGTLVVTPHGYIKNEILDHLHHVNIGDASYVDWHHVISQIDSQKSVQSARFFAYTTLTKRLHDHFVKIMND